MSYTFPEWCSWREGRRFFRFGLIGLISWTLYFFLYGFQSRIIWHDGNRVLQNFFAILLASVFNFFAHRRWTFCRTGDQEGQLGRYALVVLSSALIESILFWFGHQILHWYDLTVAVLANTLLAFYTYTLHRSFTFPEACPRPLMRRSKKTS